MSEITIYHPKQLDNDEWRQLQGIERDAFSSILNRSQAEVDALVSWNDPVTYRASHIDPSNEVGHRFNPDQSYAHQRVAVATYNCKPIGFAYSAHNVSGSSERERMIKRLSIVKNYLWIREIAVKPEYQKLGVAKDIGRTLLKDSIRFQPVSAYIWPDEYPDLMQPALEKFGFSSTGEQQVNAFGENSHPIKQLRMQAPSARTVLKRLR